MILKLVVIRINEFTIEDNYYCKKNIISACIINLLYINPLCLSKLL